MYSPLILNILNEKCITLFPLYWLFYTYVKFPVRLCQCSSEYIDKPKGWMVEKSRLYSRQRRPDISVAHNDQTDSEAKPAFSTADTVDSAGAQNG
jgi:hypothetical protein